MSNIETVKLPDGTSYNVKDAAAQPATLVTPLIIDGVTQTTVEGALGALNTGSNNAKKTDLTSIIATGSTNTTGAQIPNGAYFYLNGVFCRAIADIATNATFTQNTNYVETSVGARLPKLAAGYFYSDSYTALTTFTLPTGLYAYKVKSTALSNIGITSVDQIISAMAENNSGSNYLYCHIQKTPNDLVLIINSSTLPTFVNMKIWYI